MRDQTPGLHPPGRACFRKAEESPVGSVQAHERTMRRALTVDGAAIQDVIRLIRLEPKRRYVRKQGVDRQETAVTLR